MYTFILHTFLMVVALAECSSTASFFFSCFKILVTFLPLCISDITLGFSDPTARLIALAKSWASAAPFEKSLVFDIYTTEKYQNLQS